MTQRDKVKELVGRGLNSYHTKSLQQIDRIEKKNKEQNHKISILSNELDNDYLTKTEEGSVISLEYSKEGMVYLDELQGNTLVNYCTDGSKELTLNGDIDVEGTSVTLTEGVDNGLVDVVCEGNTLVNLCQRKGIGNNNSLYGTSGNGIITCTEIENGCKYTTRSNTQSYITARLGSHIVMKPSTTYTLIFEIEKNTLNFKYTGITLCGRNDSHFNNTGDRLFHDTGFETTVGVKKISFTTHSDISTYTGFGYGFPNINTTEEGMEFVIKNTMLLEGDWTNKEIPSEYFEGMKSVGQDDENGHKIEILSQNKNLYNPTNFKNAYINGITFSCENGILTANGTSTLTTDLDFEKNIPFYFQKGKMYSLKMDILSDNLSYPSHTSLAIKITNRNGNISWNTFKITDGVARTTFDGNNIEKIERVRFYTTGAHTFTNFRARVQIEEGSIHTDYIPYAMNKKEILLNEPLRGLPSGVKDYFIKQGGKWYIQRNVGEYIFKGNEINSSQGSVNETNLLYWNNAQSTLKNKTNVSEVLSNKLPHGKQGTSNTKGIEGISFNGKGQNLLVDIKKTMTETNEFLKDSKIIYQLETPTYEEITDPTLITYLDTTHISNNSTIPCNMKIKNSGYNAIIKPSTLYTVALDTNKSGTIGINLGGAKVTTTNNVAAITTPATLTDDSLRLYGKGIKGSKIRLLEGDKTNWIPSFFEGMKSSFEDKFDATDNTYKMEILSNNKNLLNVGESLTFDTKNIMINLKKGRYILDYKNVSGYQNGYKIVFAFYKGPYKGITSKYLRKGEVIELTEDCDRIFLYSNEYNWNGSLDKFVTINTLQLSREEVIVGEPVTQKLNKIQFSSIEPLRSLPSGVKDKFIFKDGKLMIERNTSKTKITSDMNIARSYEGWANIVFACEVDGLIPIDISTKNVYCNLLPSFSIADLCNTLGKTGIASHSWSNKFLQIAIKGIDTVDKLREWISERDMEIVYQIEPTYEEIPFELQKIILEGYENGTLFFDTNIPPTSTVTYAGETPIVKSVRLNKTEVLKNTNDINDNIVPYLMDMDYRVVCLELATETQGISMARLFGGVYEMLKRDILSNRYSVDEYRHRLDAYLGANKITEDEYNKLGDMLNE